MKKLLPLLFLLSCFSRSAVMTRQDFNDIQVGEALSQFQQRVGSPYRIRPIKGGGQEYEYIERIPMGNEVIEENHYFLIIKEGKVDGKRSNQETPPAYDLIYDSDPNDTDQQ